MEWSALIPLVILGILCLIFKSLTRSKKMLERTLKHSGFHEMVRGVRYNRNCLACRDREEKESMGVSVCPIGLSVIHCPSCAFVKEGLCDYPNTNESLLGAQVARLKARLFRGEKLDYVPLETLARIRDQARNDLESLLMVVDIPVKVC